jgi:5,10-methylenetetrahydromethanopterin reductase
MGLNPVKTAKLEESVLLLRELMAGRHAEINGSDVHFRWLDRDPGIPVMMAATGPKNLRMAGALADRVMLYVGVNETSLRWAIDHVRAGAEGSGRDPDAVKLSVLTAMWVGDDQEEAWDRCRWAPAACANHIADTMRRTTAHGMPETMTRLPRSRDDYDYYAGHLSSEADHTAYLTGELIDDFTLAGPAAKVRAKAQELFALGIDEISCAYLNGSFDQMETVGREIISAVATSGRAG